MFRLRQCQHSFKSRYRYTATLPDIRSIHELTLIFSELFIIFNASSNNTSPVNVSSMTSITLSASGNRLLELSFCMLTLPLNASSITIHPRSAYDMLSFQKLRYPCLSFSPISNISSMSVSLGCFDRSAFSEMSRGSKAILWPFELFSYAVSGDLRSSFFLGGAGEETRLPSSFSVLVPPAPRRRVRPEPDDEAISSGE